MLRIQTKSKSQLFSFIVVLLVYTFMCSVYTCMCVCTCLWVRVHLEARNSHLVFSLLCLTYWGRVHIWIQNSPIWGLGRPVSCYVAQTSLLLQAPKCRDYNIHVTLPSLINALFDSIPDILPVSSCAPATKASVSLLSSFLTCPLASLDWSGGTAQAETWRKFCFLLFWAESLPIRVRYISCAHCPCRHTWCFLLCHSFLSELSGSERRDGARASDAWAAPTGCEVGGGGRAQLQGPHRLPRQAS